MAEAPQQPREEASAPSCAVRVAWWLAIYLAGSMPLIARTLFEHIHMPPEGFFLWPFIFPMAVPALCFIYPLHLYATLKAGNRRSFDCLLLFLVIIVLANQWVLAEMASLISV